MASAYAAALEALRRERGKSPGGAASPAAVVATLQRGAGGGVARLPLQSPAPKRKREASEAEAPRRALQPQPAQRRAASPAAQPQPQLKRPTHAASPAARQQQAPAAAGGGAKARVKQQKRHSGVAVSGPSHDAAAPRQRAGAAEHGEEAAAPQAAALTKRQKLMASVHLPSRAPVTPAEKSALSFDTDWHDHCETPFDAYRDVEPLLFQLAARAGRTKATLRIYDRACLALNRVSSALLTLSLPSTQLISARAPWCATWAGWASSRSITATRTAMQPGRLGQPLTSTCW
jgi:hypothetical protein